MNRFLQMLFGLMAIGCLVAACEESDSYAEDRKRENKQIQSFLKRGATIRDAEGDHILLEVPAPINVIKEEEFYANDSVTDVARNEYVLFKNNGVYMQIVNRGTGKPLASGESASVVCRFIDFNIAADTLELSNKITAETVPYPDIMTVQNYLGTFTASFKSGVLPTAFSSSGSGFNTTVPAAWLIPLTYINLARLDAEEDELAVVRLIVPSTQGHALQLDQIYPCFYEISYRRGR